MSDDFQRSDRWAKFCTVLHWQVQILATLSKHCQSYSSRRPSMAFSIVISSVYSMSLPTGIPVAMRVTFTPRGLSCSREISRGGFAFDGGVGGDDDFVDLAALRTRGKRLPMRSCSGPTPCSGEIAPCST